MAFVIDTSRLDVIRSDIGYSCIPKISSAYNTVISIRTNLPSKVLNKKWINSNLKSLYRDIDNINDDVVKIQNLLYKAVEKMNEAERRSLRWNSLKNNVVTKGQAVMGDIRAFGENLSNDYEEAKSWFSDVLDKAYETGADVVESVSNWIEDLTWEDVKDFFKTTGATIVVALESLTKGLITLLQAIVDLVVIALAIVGTVFTGIEDGINYILTGESGGYTKALWDDTMASVAEIGTLTNDCCNWITENNPDWVTENSLIEAGGTVDQIIQGIGYMLGIVGISVATFGAATPVALAVTAGTLGFAKGTAEAWEEGKDAFGGLIMGTINGGWEALQYYVGGKIGTSVFGKITGKIANPILQKLAVSGLRIAADSLTGAVEVPFQSMVAMVDTRVDGIDGNELSWDEAWEASGGWIGVIEQTAIAGIGSSLGEVVDFGKAFRSAKINGTSISDALGDIYLDDLNMSQLNKENPWGRFSKNKNNIDIADNIDDQVKNSFPNDAIDDGAVAMANYRTSKGMTQQFRFSDPSNLPDLDSSFWKNIDNPDKIIINVNGRQMSFDDAISYKANYDLNMKDIDVKVDGALNVIKNSNDGINVVDVNLKEIDELAKVNLKIDDDLARFNSAKVFSDDLEVAIEYGDAKQYLFHKLKNQAEITNDPQLVNLYNNQIKLKNADKSFDELYTAMYKYLGDDDINALSSMLGNNVNFTKQELDTIYAYSRVTGPTLTALERGTDTRFVTTKGQVGLIPGSDKKACQRLFDDQRACILGDYSQIKIDDAIATMDNVIKKSPPLMEDTVLYRGVNNVFFDGKQLNITDLKPGQIINDKATVSTSLLKSKAYNQNDIMLEILAPKGTKGAYIESFVGGYGQQEFLLGRNTKFKVLDNPITDPITGKTTIKVEIVPPDSFTTKLRNTGSNIISNFDSKAKRLFGKGNVTAELNDNIGTGFVKSHVTVELTDNYPNKFVNKTKSSNVIDKMNLRNFKADVSVKKYNDLFNKMDTGLDVDDFVNNLKRKGLLDKFDKAIDDIDSLYSRPPGPGVIHHDVSHVERVMLFAMDMGDKLKLSNADMDLLVDVTKYHDVGVYGGHGNHALRSADEAIKNLQGKYSENQLKKIAAIIECHEIDDRNYVLNNLDNSPAFMDTLNKYNIPQSEREATIKIINILKDADALDRTRFRNNLNTNYFRNTNEANNLVKTSYEMQEVYGKLSLDNKIKNHEFTATQIHQINNYRNIGIPDYVIEQSYATYNMWGNAGRRLFNTPDEMIRNWMLGAGYQF